MGCSPPSRLPPGSAPVILHRRAGPARAKPDRGAELLQRGYMRRTTAAQPRLDEIVAEYRRIGFDVEVIAHEPSADQCNACFGEDSGGAGDCDVYVRQPPAPRHGEPLA
ncbi:MAG TPA: hypothetical protein PKB14_23335 [Rubrivivax sp.]|nr:hypothetical protein [Rubrivivax sp.]